MGLFRAELARRGLQHAVDDLGRWAISDGSVSMLVSLDNLERQLVGDSADPRRVAWFTDQVIAAARSFAVTAAGLYWFLEPNDYSAPADYRAQVSPKLDRVLVHADDGGALIRWMSRGGVDAIGLTAAEAAERAWANLDSALRQAEVRTQEMAGVPVAMFTTTLASKSSLLLAPALRDAIGEVVGWPVLAVAPDRDFLCVWNADRRDLIAHLGGIVAGEHARAPYPLSTEIFRISDSVRAIGTYAVSRSGSN